MNEKLDSATQESNLSTMFLRRPIRLAWIAPACDGKYKEVMQRNSTPIIYHVGKLWARYGIKPLK